MAAIPEELRAPKPTPAVDADGPMCMAAYVHGTFQDYIPVFVYSVLRSYPDYHVRIFLRETVAPHNRRALDAIRAEWAGRFDVRENVFSELDGFVLKGARWLLPYAALSDFEYAYIGDVDYIVCRESPDIRAWHVGYCREQNLPYSNALRIRGAPIKKMTGMHFIRVKPYYEEMAAVIEETRRRIQETREHPYVGASDEYMLYDLVERGIGRFPPKWFRPDHGIHLGAIRQEKARREFYRKRRAFVRGELMPDPLFREIKRHMGREVRREVLRAQALCGHWWHGLR